MTTSEAPPDLLAAIQRDPKARATYEGLSAQNRFGLTFRLLAIKTDEGRKKRIAAYVAMLARGEAIHAQASRAPDADRVATSRRAKTSRASWAKAADATAKTSRAKR